jgi:serine/threonine protein kinase
MRAPGTKLSRYEIRSKLAEGGMGEVYLAFDSELNRTVAVKVLHQAVAANEQRVRASSMSAKCRKCCKRNVRLPVRSWTS